MKHNVVKFSYDIFDIIQKNTVLEESSMRLFAKAKTASKKLTYALAMMALMIAMVLVFSLHASAAGTGVIPGDANGDGIVNGKDVTRLNKYLENYDPATDSSTVSVGAGADVNEDGVINEQDLVVLLNCLSNFNDYADNADEVPVVRLGFYIEDDYVYYYDDEGLMCKDATIDGYTFGADGKLIGNEIFLTFKGNTYYIINNKIVYDYQIINDRIYFFKDGIMLHDTVYEGNTFGSYGFIVADHELVQAGGNTYYLINNTITYGMQVIENKIYSFGEEGVMLRNAFHDGYNYGNDGFIVDKCVFVNINGNVYYIENTFIVFNYIVINNKIYNFGDDGIMNKDTVIDGNQFGPDGYIVGDKIFVNIEGDTYYIINNIIVYNYIVINDKIYNFGDDGIMNKDTEIDGNQFGPDGYIVGDKIFVFIEGDIYYIINNIIVYNYIVISDQIFNFGDDGKMKIDTIIDGNQFGPFGFILGDEIFVNINGDTYYLVENTIVYGYRIINRHIYNFGIDGIMKKNVEIDNNDFGPNGYILGDKLFVNVEGDTYYLINNTITYGYIIIGDRIYYFGDDGVMKKNTIIDDNQIGSNGYIVGDGIFVTIDGDTYYLVDNKIVYGYQIINGKLYNFGNDGVMYKNLTSGGYYYGSNGYVEVSTRTLITIDDVTYIILVNDNIYKAVSVSGIIYESDNDFDSTNNPLIEGVNCVLTVDGEIFSCISDGNGKFDFGLVPATAVALEFTKFEYITATATLTLTEDEELTIVMDINVSNTLSGKISIADADMNYSNNSPLAGATVTLERFSSTNVYRRETTTDSYGYYSFTGLTAGAYKLIVSCPGYITVEQTLTVRYNESNIQNLQIEAISSTQINDGYAEGTITDAKTGLPVAGLTLYIREGIGNSFGEAIMTLTTDSNGKYRTDALKPGNYTVQVVDERELENEDERYGTILFAIKIVSDRTITEQNATTSNKIGIVADSIRVVLNWGSTPSDLDSHLYADMNDGTSDYHIYYSSKTNGSIANLDVDDTSSYGPETVTVSYIGSGIYKYYVHDYSGKSNTSSSNLKNSGAQVKVYLGGSASPAYTFYVPNGLGTYWHVFTYNSQTGEFIVVNEISNSAGY